MRVERSPDTSTFPVTSDVNSVLLIICIETQESSINTISLGRPCHSPFHLWFDGFRCVVCVISANCVQRLGALTSYISRSVFLPNSVVWISVLKCRDVGCGFDGFSFILDNYQGLLWLHLNIDESFPAFVSVSSWRALVTFASCFCRMDRSPSWLQPSTLVIWRPVMHNLLVDYCVKLQ